MTKILVANRSGMAQAPDGSKYRLAAGRTLADARHPLVQAYPDLFSPYAIELSVAAEDDASPATSEATAAAQAEAEGYRMQLAAIVDGLQARGLVDESTDMSYEGWLSATLFGIIDRQQTGADPSPVGQPAADATASEPEALPKPRKRAARPRPAAVSDAEE